MQATQPPPEPLVLDVIPQPAGRRHQQVHLPAERAGVLGHRHAAEDARDAQLTAGDEADGGLCDLCSKLTRRR
eukprot:1257311-Prymnesium_polylepis.2